MLEYRVRGIYERERMHAECEERNLPNENACKSYAYRKTTTLKRFLINNMPGCGWGFSNSYGKQCLSVMRAVLKIWVL